MFLSHGHLPPKLIQTTIVPIIKNKCGNISSSNNHRPIALATIISKLLESILLMKCEEYLCTSANQFGFKKAHETELCIYTLREYIELYRKRSTTVFVTFLNASKAFDRLDHWLLFKKLIKRKVPLFVVRLLIVWYSLQRMHIRWGNTFSTFFCVSNGVKQGGIILFALYVNQLTNQLIVCKEGCYFNDMCINHVLYADDICLLAPTASAMQTLLDVCYEYGIDNDILFNPIKSVCTVFKPKAYKLYLPTVFIGSDALKFIKESKYLGFTFNDSKSDDCDMLRQMRLLYAKSNKLLRTFSHCSTDVKITLFQSYCTALYCPYL